LTSGDITGSSHGELIICCTDLYFQLGYQLLYGHIQDDLGMTAFWARRGSNILAPGDGLYLGPQLGRPFGIKPEQGGRLITRWRWLAPAWRTSAPAARAPPPADGLPDDRSPNFQAAVMVSVALDRTYRVRAIFMPL
jgi:hypothetical protein